MDRADMTHPLTPREKVVLKPCPFCGGEAFAGSNFDNDHYVMCGADCDKCGGMVGYMKTEMAAIESWNRRTALASGSGDHAELARLTVVATDAASLGDGLQEAALTRFQAHANPATVLALIAEVAALREQVKFEKQVAYDENDRWQEAERKLAEAVGHVEQLVDRLHSIRDSSIVLIAARTFLSKEAERG